MSYRRELTPEAMNSKVQEALAVLQEFSAKEGDAAK